MSNTNSDNITQHQPIFGHLEYDFFRTIFKFSLIAVLLSILIYQIGLPTSKSNPFSIKDLDFPFSRHLFTEKMSEQVVPSVDKNEEKESGDVKQSPQEEIVGKDSAKTDAAKTDAANTDAAKTDAPDDNSKLESINSIYEFTVKDLDGNDVSLSKYKGNVVLIVNVASNCGFTKNHYNQMNQLYEKYESQGLRIAAFPCNQFAGQEPGCAVDIKEFIKKNGVKFDVYDKIDVNGSNAHPLFRWLKMKQKGIFNTQAIKWNFTKFLINKEGNPIKRYSPTTSPNSCESEIQALL